MNKTIVYFTKRKIYIYLVVEIVVIKKDGKLNGGTVYWPKAESVYWAEEDLWVLRGEDGNIIYADKESQHYSDCMREIGIVPRKN